MTLDVHHPSPADVDPLGEGLSARRCRQRASERDKSQQFTTMCFMVVRLSPSIHLVMEAAPQVGDTYNQENARTLVGAARRSEAHTRVVFWMSS